MPLVMLRIPSRPHPRLPSSYEAAVGESRKSTRCFSRNWFGRPRGGSRPEAAGCRTLVPLGVSRVQRPSGTCAPFLFLGQLSIPHSHSLQLQGGRGVAAGTHPLQHSQCRCCTVPSSSALPLGSPFLNGLRKGPPHPEW